MADISKIDNGTEYNLKDATARAGIESSKTLKSSVVTVNDAAPINAEDITVDITPVQDLHGYSKPWAGGGWKNRLPILTDSESLYGVDFTMLKDSANNKLGIDINGTLNRSSFGYEFARFSLAAGSYILTGIPLNTDIPTHQILIYSDDFSRTIAFVNNVNQQSASFTLTEAQTIRVQLYVYQATYINVIVYPMIRLSTETDATFAPYSNICPIEGRTGAELTQKDAATNPTVTRTYSTDFGETVYGGKWHVTKGGTNKTYGYVEFDGSDDEDWVVEGAPALASGSLRFTYLGVLSAPITPSANIPNMLTNGLSVASGDATWNSVDNAVSISLSGTDITIRVAGIDTVAKLKEWLSNNLVQVCYELNTPTTISTPKQSVPMLKGINTVYADCGDTSLKYQPDNVIGELKGEIQKANSFVSKMALREGSGAKDFSYGGWSFRLYIYRSMGQISMSVERISASSVTEQAVVKTFNGESDYRAPEELRPRFDLLQAATYTTPSGWALQVYLKDDGYIMITGMAPAVGASAPTSSNWNLVEPWATHQQAKDLFNN